MDKRWKIGLVLLWVGLVAWGCGKKVEPDPPKQIEETPGVMAHFDTQGGWKTEETFFHFPYPSELRLNAQGGPDATGFPNPASLKIIDNVLSIVGGRKGFPVIPVAYFQFKAALAKRNLAEVLPLDGDAPAFLVDVDPDSPAKGTRYPIVATELEPGTYVPDHLLALSTYPGIVLSPKRLYAFVLMRSYQDAEGKPLGVSKAFNQLKAGETPEGALGAQLKTLYAPLWNVLKEQNVNLDEVAGATVFRTGGVVEETARIAEALRTQHKPTIENLKLDPDDGDHERYCEILGTIVQPQFQQGTPPFNSEGLFELDDKGVPKKQRDKELPIVVTIPKKPMPAGGYPLLVYVHGSGGLTSQVVDRGLKTQANGRAKKGEGPSHVVAPFGVATASTAMPVNPERVKGASAIAYLNLGNLKAFRDTFRQGVFEGRLFLDALLRLRIPKDALGSCQGATLPAGETHFRFQEKRIVLMGQSMGGMYTNMIGAVEPRYEAVIPTGAGGYWSFFALNSNVALLNEDTLAVVLGSKEKLTHAHPVLHFLQTAWEPAEPLVYVPHLARTPLSNHPVRHIYQPIGQSDSYFPENVLDIMTLAYGNQRAGDDIWPGTSERLKVMKLDAKADYPIKHNRTSAGGKAYTGVVVQYKPDDLTKDGHTIAFQLDAVKYQYGCFLSTFIKSGIPVVPAPASLGTPCPE